MRLINTHTLKLEDFMLSEKPQYAILSHTWGKEEISFQEMTSPNQTTHQKQGFLKIVQACQLAQQESYDLIWIDTCCIDKTSSAELSEAINSMFQWYADASKCYVYLVDLAPGPLFDVDKTRWLTRGWTLQELLAPRLVEFYDNTWSYRGSKADFAGHLSSCTDIKEDVLLSKRPLSQCSVAERMSWARARQTTRPEDNAYCLLGIFDINMPLLYGEGSKAFRRLQEQIIRQSDDLSMFAWDLTTFPGFNSSHPAIHPMPLLAPSAANFTCQPARSDPTKHETSFSLTNKGLFFSGVLILQILNLRLPTPSQNVFAQSAYALWLCKGTDGQSFSVYLRKIGPKVFCRDGRLPLARSARNFSTSRIYSREQVANPYILTNPDDAIVRGQRSLNFRSRRGQVFVPNTPLWRVGKAAPAALWDCTDQIFLRSFDDSVAKRWVFRAVHLQSILTTMPDIVVIIVNIGINSAPKLEHWMVTQVLAYERNKYELSLLFDPNTAFTADDILRGKVLLPSLRYGNFGERIKHYGSGGQVFFISASLEQRMFSNEFTSASERIPVYKLKVMVRLAQQDKALATLDDVQRAITVDRI